jgi:hypothetical protein
MFLRMVGEPQPVYTASCSNMYKCINITDLLRCSCRYAAACVNNGGRCGFTVISCETVTSLHVSWNFTSQIKAHVPTSKMDCPTSQKTQWVLIKKKTG